MLHILLQQCWLANNLIKYRRIAPSMQGLLMSAERTQDIIEQELMGHCRQLNLTRG